LIPGSANRNLDFTAVPNNSFIPAEESGCAMVKDPRAGERDRIPGAFALLLPAAVLAVRRILRGTGPGPRRGVAD
jgi:hypothetical protein